MDGATADRFTVPLTYAQGLELRQSKSFDLPNVLESFGFPSEDPESHAKFFPIRGNVTCGLIIRSGSREI